MTALTRWNPFQEMQNLRAEMNRLFEPFLRRDVDFGSSLTAGTWIPPVDVEETEDRIFVRAELPGMKKEEIGVEYENGILTIRGERQFENERKERNFHRLERAYGSFVRSFALPSSVDVDTATARYENGVLELSIPKKEEAKPRRIPIGEGTTHRQIGTSKAA